MEDADFVFICTDIDIKKLEISSESMFIYIILRFEGALLLMYKISTSRVILYKY